MKFLASLLAILALFQTACGQSFPLTSLSVSAVDYANPSIAVSGNGIKPSFSAYRLETLRYAAEFVYATPLTLTFSFSGVSTVTARQCSFLGSPSASTNSYCFFSPTVVGSSSVTFQNVFPGSNYFELAATFTVNGISYPALYLVTIGIFASNTFGSNMLSLQSNDVYSDYEDASGNTLAYSMTTSQYTLVYDADQSTSISTVMVPFYFSAQLSVSTVFVQECPGLLCSACDINAISQKVIIAGNQVSGFSNVPQSQLDLANGNLGIGSTSGPKHGKYNFPSLVGNNCVRFINRVDQGASGTNDYTITIGLNVLNCAAYTSCQACVLTGCGWCNNNQFNINSGSCRVGGGISNAYAATGTTCYPSNSFSVSPRWISNSVITPNDPTSCVSTLRGDPRISGLQGQDFQVHGTPNEYFNLVSTPTLQVNSRFVFLDEAQCDNFTTCFSHAGTYIDEVGVMMADNKVRIVAAAISQPARVFINGKEVQVSAHKHTAGEISVTFANARRIVVKTPEFMMTISQSDKFFNMESALLKMELLDQGSKLTKIESSVATEANTVMHGLIGQTWRNTVYAGDREYEGEVPDYQVADGIWGKDFHFNLYKN